MSEAELEGRFVTLNIVRGNEAVASYRVEYEDQLTVAAALGKIYLGQDRTIAYRHYSCNVAHCASCLVKLDGKNVYTCRHILKPGADVRLEACDIGRPIRDLVTDLGATRSGSKLIRTIEI
jgi:succinate dehydrogenase/fumarate reductase-like Fe-S protein